MYELRANAKHNAMLVVVDGKMTMDDALEFNQKYRKCVDSLEPGFAVIVDLTRVIATSEEVRQELTKANAYAVENGLGRVVRVVPGDMTSTIGNMQLNRSSRELGYETEIVGSLDEAKELLGIS